MTLQVPEWALDRSAPCVILNPEEDVYEFYLLGKDKAPLLDVFREYGEKGMIKLPEEAMAKVRPLLGRMAALIPLRGDLANAAGETGLTRIKGDATPLVRLSTEDDALVIALRVRPAADAKNVFIRSVKLDGRELGRLYVTTKELQTAKALEFELAPSPEGGAFERMREGW